MAEETTTAAAPERGRQQTKIGRVVSNRMDKTIVVAVTSTFMHPLYRRYIKKTSKFYAHDPENRCGIGDEVEIVSSRPLSKLKRWRLRQVVRKAE